MRRYLMGLGALALMVVGSTAAAQRAQWEIGAFGQASYFDDNTRLDDSWLFGGRLGVFFWNGIGIEADVATGNPRNTLTGDEDSFTPVYARLTWNSPMDRPAQLVLGVGGVRNTFDDEGEGALNVLAGMRFMPWGALGFRADALMDYQTAVERTNWHFRLGVSWLPGFGRVAAPRIMDGDRDGVRDDLDRCLDTPSGDAVDASGCSLPKDADADGVRDADDACANTPAGTRVDARGCPAPAPVDSDNDGVMDPSDRCANTPAGTPVDASGCPDASRIDTDGDGVMDANDRCSFTPAGTKVDATGCPPPPDSDNDGVADPNDQCPTTAAGVTVDAVGCPVVFTETSRTFTLRGVTFQTGSATLAPSSNAVLDEMATVLKNNPEVKVEVAGHTDNVGSDAANHRLSHRRAQSVRAYLISQGVAAERLTAVGYGEREAIADNATAEGRAQNRRVELRKID